MERASVGGSEGGTLLGVGEHARRTIIATEKRAHAGMIYRKRYVFVVENVLTKKKWKGDVQAEKKGNRRAVDAFTTA